MMVHVYDDDLQLEGKIELSLGLITKYYYYKKYHKKYDILNYYLEDGGKELVRDIEDRWLHNKIDEIGLSHSEDFKRFILEFCHDEISFPEKYTTWYDEITMEEYINLSNQIDEMYNITLDDEVID